MKYATVLISKEYTWKEDALRLKIICVGGGGGDCGDLMLLSYI